jgi:type IV pilus assembly protein PilZ
MNIIKLTVASKAELAKVYIKQFKFGGVFVVGNVNYQLGDELFLLINLPDDNGSLALNVKVAWLSPTSAVSYPAGIGLSFTNDKAGFEAKAKIEVMLGGLLQHNNTTFTF